MNNTDKLSQLIIDATEKMDGWVYEDWHDEMMDELRTEKDDEIKKLKDEISGSKEAFSFQYKENKALKDGRVEQYKEITSLKDEIKKLKEAPNLTHLLDTNELQYKNQITSLKEEIEDLNGGIKCIEEERGILEDKNKELKEEIDELKTLLIKVPKGSMNYSYMKNLEEENEKLKNTIKMCQELLRAIN